MLPQATVLFFHLPTIFLSLQGLKQQVHLSPLRLPLKFFSWSFQVSPWSPQEPFRFYLLLLKPIHVLDFYYSSPTILVLRSIPFICAALWITSNLVSYDFPGSGILEGFGFVFLSQRLSSVCRKRAGTLEGVVKERKGTEQLWWPGIFLSSCSLRASPCGLSTWTSLGFLTSWQPLGELDSTWQLKASRVSIPASKA